MKEKVTPTVAGSCDVHIQFYNDLVDVGLGLEPKMGPDIPTHHFIDMIYGERHTQVQIGKIFFDQMSEIGLRLERPDFQDVNSEEDFYNNLGRRILDSVTGSSPVTGLWTWLDRPAINRLIRLLRKARDTAYGRDE